MRWRIATYLGVQVIAWTAGVAPASVYQWSAPIPAAVATTTPATTAPATAPSTPAASLPRAYLWIPPDCERVRAVVIGQHNMLEEDILDDTRFRDAMGKLGFAIVWISPALGGRWDQATLGARLDSALHALAEQSGYAELAFAPVVPIGHSACASFPWNFAAANPKRTLAILSIHGDAPKTPLAGFGPQNVTWPDAAIDGIPGLMAMGEYEWSDARLAPAMVFRAANPKSPIAVLAEPGAGHFAAADTLVPFLNLFLQKVAAARLPADAPIDRAPELKPIDASTGWLVERWWPGVGRRIEPAPAKDYLGDRFEAFWAVDGEMSAAIQNYRADQLHKRPQLIGFEQDGQLLPATPTHPMYTLKFEPDSDGVTFRIDPVFLDKVADMGAGHAGPGGNNQVRWSHLPVGSAIGHSNAGAIAVHRIEGPMEEVGPNTFRLSFERGTTPGEHPAMWFAATHPGDEQYESAVQQAVINLPRRAEGEPQTITFDPIGDVAVGAGPIRLKAMSSAGLPVHFYVREGPASVEGDALSLLPLPPRAPRSVSVTVIAWQWGQTGERPVQTAEPVERSFHVTRNP